MIKFLHDLKWMFAVAVASVFAGCSNAEVEDTTPTVDPPFSMELKHSSVVYYGYGDAPSCDHYTLYLYTDGMTPGDSGFSGSGTGLCLDIFSPMRADGVFPAGDYTARKPSQMGQLYTFEPEKSYISKPGVKVAVTGGSFEVAVSGGNYTIKGEIVDAGGEIFSFVFSGLLQMQDHIATQVLGSYYGDAIAPNCTTYSLILATPKIVKNGFDLSGMGQAICLTLYAPLGSGAMPEPGTYSVYSGLSAGAQAFRFQGGKGDGSLNGLSGSFVYGSIAPGKSELVYVEDGTVTIAVSGGVYSIRVDLTGENGRQYTMQYEGAVAEFEDRSDLSQEVALSKSGGLYLGTMMSPNFDNFSLYMLSEGVDDTNMSFSGVGIGVYFDFYVPIAGTTRIPAGTYTLSATPAAYTFLPGEDMGGMTSGSFVYVMKQGDADKQYIPIVSGSFTVKRDKRIYTVEADVVCSDGKRYQFIYTGKIESIMDPMDAVTYVEMKSAETYYFRDMFDPKYDNWTFAICGDGVQMSPSLSIEGTGMAVCFDLYTPLAGNPAFPPNTYLPFGGGSGESKEYKYMPGEDYGEGMLIGSYVWIKKAGAEKPTYVYVEAGPLSVEKSGENYTIKAKLLGDDGEEYNLKFTGVLTIYDPFADL